MCIRVFVAVLVFVPAARSDDWPQFRGPNRDGVSRETGLLADWPKDVRVGCRDPPDVTLKVQGDAKARGFHLLHKPVDPMALRAMFNQAIKRAQTSVPPKPPAPDGTHPDIFTSLDSPAASNQVH